jgi:hypothetical protein
MIKSNTDNVKQDKEGIVYKSVGSIEINNSKVSLVQRKAWNLLFFHAYRELLTERVHKIRVQDIALALGYKDVGELKQILRQLRALEIQWNYGKHSWGVSGFLAEARIEDNVLHYEYGSFLTKELADPAHYARISLAIQKNFSSKYSLVLYEIAAAYYIASRRWGQTDWYEIDRLRVILGCKDDAYYDDYKYFARNILKKAIAEVNQKSDFHLEIEKKIDRRHRVTHIRFIITPQPETSKMLNALTAPYQPELPVVGNALWQRLIAEYGLSHQQATEIIERYEADDIMTKLVYVASRNPVNIAAYTYSAITRDYKQTQAAITQTVAPAPASGNDVDMTIALRDGEKVQIGDKIYELQDGFAVGKRGEGSIPANQIRALLKNGKATLL